MVGRVFKALQQEIRGLHEAAYFLGIFALVSQLLALLRDRTFAHVFGAGRELDVYFAAFRVPDLVFVLLASLVSAYVLIPFLSERFTVSKEEANTFLNEAFSFFLVLIGAVSLVVCLLMPLCVALVVPGLVGTEHFGDIVLLSRILLIQPILLGLSGILGSVTQLRHRFVLYSLSPILYNLGIISGALFFYNFLGIIGLGVGVLIGALLHFLIQIPAYRDDGFRFAFVVPGKRFYRMLGTAIPRSLALMSGQLSMIALVSIASFFTAGSIAVFTFSYNLQSVPLSIIAVSYSVAAFPTLAGFFARKEHQEFLLHMSIAVKHIIFWSVPAMVLFVVLRAQIVRVVLGSGAFSWEDTRLTAAALAIFVLALVAQSLSMLFVRAYYAAGKTATPFWVSGIGTIATIGFGVGLSIVFEASPFFRTLIETLLRIEGLRGGEVLMLALAYALGSWLSALLFTIMFRRDFGNLADSLPRASIHIFSASIVAGYAAYLVLLGMAPFVDMNTFFGIFAQGAVAGVAGIGTLAGILWLIGNEEFKEVAYALTHKLLPQHIPPGQDTDTPSV